MFAAFRNLFTVRSFGLHGSLLLLFVCCQVFRAAAQAPKVDTADKITIVIANTGVIEHFQTDSGSFNKFVTDVVVYQGTDTLYCDSLYQFIEKKKLEAFGDVRIVQQGGTEGTCDYLRYTSDKKLAYMTGNVGLTDGQNKLWCEELTYDLGTKVGVYDKGGTLQSDSTLVSSNTGTYYVHTHEARFTGNVKIDDPKYKVVSDDLGYNTETKVETFYANSVVTSDSGKSVLITRSGTYDSKNVVARFTGHSSIWNDGQYIEADLLHYEKATGYGYAIGNVVSIDTAQHATLYCGRADFFRKQRVLWAIIKPVMQFATGNDTFYMRADTFYSAPMVKVLGSRYYLPIDTVFMPVDTSSSAIDSLSGTDGHKKVKDTEKDIANRVDSLKAVIPVPDSTWGVPPRKYRLFDFVKDSTGTWLRANDTLITVRKGRKSGKNKPPVEHVADTSAPIFFTGYHHVRIFSDSTQALCDSICLTRSDTVLRMFYSPVAWGRASQISGDTMLMQLDTSGVRSMYIPQGAFMASQSGPPQAELYDQVQGRTLSAFFKDNAIKKVIVRPDAHSIYYSKDDGGAYLGVVQVSSVLMRIFFGPDELETIKYEQDVHDLKMTPLEKADLPSMRLEGFNWRYKERPMSKEDLFK